jgi:hypothetical protein
VDPRLERQMRMFLRGQGRCYLPRRQYWHHVVADFFMRLRFVLVSVERLATHPVWRVRLKLTADAQHYLLLGLVCSHPWAPDLVGRQLRVAVIGFLREHAQKILARDIVVVQSGDRIQVLFPGPMGAAGIWKPSRVNPWRRSLVVRRWLRAQAN